MSKFNFEEFTLRNTPISDKVMRVSLHKKGNFSLNKAAFEALGNPKAVTLLFDKEKKVVGLRPVNPEVRHAYSVRTQNNSKSHLIGAISFCKYYDIDASKTRVFEPELVEGDLVFELEKAIDVTQRAPRQNGKHKEQLTFA
jgi:hypothetical protein